ncbi:MAG TPA: M1 family metallopeptidase [Vicinamibacterales bacterium]|nr:M1 family metallopeptidase [Vicinamibacterales bacterium]
MRTFAACALVAFLATPAPAQAQQQGAKPEPPTSLRAPSRAELLRGEYGRYRANNDLLYYDLDVRIDPAKKWISGKNSVRFKMLKDDTRIQLELYANLSVDRIVHDGRELKYTRDLNTVYIDFPDTLRSGRTYTIDFHYSGAPLEVGRFDALAFKKDPAGGDWINTANEGVGSSVWWPSKDQWRDEPEGMDIRVSVPNPLVNVSNGRFIGKTDLGDGYTKWHYRVHYPINSYNVSLNIANYVHFGETMGELTLDYYVLPANLEKARRQFAQVKPMMDAFQKYFGPYPFPKDGFKLIEVPYSGMEHQSAVTYGNRFANGYLERDWTGVGVSLKFDFIIIHETAHEWFGNAVSAAEQSDMWIHEAWATYMECLYVEHMFGYDDALKYTNGYKTKIGNKEPIIVQRGLARDPNQDQYFKGALFLHTLRSVVGDLKWFKLIRDVYDQFKYRNIMTEELVAFVNKQLSQNLTPVFDQYLRRAALPVLELTFNEAEQLVWYRWNADETAFAMPIRVGDPSKWQTIQPTSDWKSMPWRGAKDAFKVATDLYYVNVAILDAAGRREQK